MTRIQKAAILGMAVCWALAAASVVYGQASTAAANGIAPVKACADVVNFKIAGTNVQITKAEEVPAAPPGTVRASMTLAPDMIPVAIPSYCRANGVIDPRTGVDGKVGTATTDAANSEIERGARLLPHRSLPHEIALKKASADLSGEIVAAAENKLILSRYDIVYVDLGASDGLRVGNLLYLSRSRKATELAKRLNHPFHLPDILLGSAVVVATQPHTATALILKVADPVYLQDKVFTTTK